MPPLRSYSLGALGACVLGLAVSATAFEDRTPRVHALVGARVVIKPGEVKEGVTVVLRDGVIVDVGRTAPPADARVWQLDGLTLYPGLIEPYLDPAAGASRPEEGEETKEREKNTKTDAGVRHPNPKVRAETRVVEALSLDNDDLENLRAAGITLVHLVPGAGIFRGQSALVLLRPGGPDEQIVRADVAHLVAFERANWGDRNPTYPSSLMGAVALVRQTFNDAAWAAAAQEQYAARRAGFERPQSNLAWDALASAERSRGHRPVWMLTEDVLGSLRCAALGKELDLNLVLVGNGEEYKQVNAVRDAGWPVILPVNYPKPPEFEDDDEATVELDVLQHWNQAPANAARLHAAGVVFAFTSHGMGEGKPVSQKLDGSEYLGRIRKAIEQGLPAEAALAAVTTTPAKLLGVERDFGSIEKGKVANLVVTDGDLFAEKTQILDVWVDGEHFEVRDKKRDDFANVRGTWKVVAGDADKPTREWTLDVEGDEWTMRAKVEGPRGDLSVESLRWERGLLEVKLPGNETLRLRPASGKGKKGLSGTWVRADGSATDIEASKPEPTLGGAQ